MATMILLPDASSGHTSHWVENTSTHHGVLQSDDGDTSYVACSADGRRLVVEYANPSVSSGDIASITSVRFLSSGRHTGRSGTADVDISFLTPSAGFEETAEYDASPSSYETINGTARTTSDGSNAWTYSDLQNLSLRLTKNGTNEVYMTMLTLEVTYVPTAPSTYTSDDATILSGGVLELKNGITKLG